MSYHSALYRQVESTSVTPFSPRARDRALHAVLDRARATDDPGARRQRSARGDRRPRSRARAPRSRRSSSVSSAVDPERGRGDRRASSTRSSTQWRSARATVADLVFSSRSRPRQDAACRRRRERRLEDGTLPDPLVAARRRPGVQPLPGEELMPSIKGQRPAQPARHDLRRRLDRRARGRVVHGRRHRPLAGAASRTCTSPVSNASSTVTRLRHRRRRRTNPTSRSCASRAGTRARNASGSTTTGS